MDLLVAGRRYPDDTPIAAPITERDLARAVLDGLGPNADPLQTSAEGAGRLTTFRAALDIEPGIDLANPLSAGWTVLVAADDPQADAKLDAIRPLAKLRGAEDLQPLRFDADELFGWSGWLDEHYTSLDAPPHYVLILADPQRVPFGFQAFLDAGASVGRLDFADVADLAAYAEKVVRLESATEPVVSDSALFFAPDGGPGDPTHYSARFMAQPLIELVRDELQRTTIELLGDHTTKAELVAALTASDAALIYTASHGAVDYDGPLERRRAINGAIRCRTGMPGERVDARLFSAADVPTEPFLEGAIFFQFACYGAGTPARSDFAHWGIPGLPAENASEDFLAALPLRLLAHPRGPVAFVGHIDVALLHGFDDPDAPEISDRSHPRLQPFRRAVQRLLKGQPVGYAMTDLNERFGRMSAALVNAYDRRKSGTLPDTPQIQARIVDAFCIRNDAQNYIVLGDPAARALMTRST